MYMIIQNNHSCIIYFKNRRTNELFNISFPLNITNQDIKIRLSNHGYNNPLLLVKREGGGYSDCPESNSQNIAIVSRQEPIQVAYTLE